MEAYRSGYNGPHSKCGYRAIGTRVRIPSLPPKNSTSFDLSNFFIHCESNGISSRVSVYLITEGAYHQPKAVFAFAMMIYNGKPLVIYNSFGIDDIHASRRDLAASTLVSNKRRQQAAALQKILYMFRKVWYNSINK